MRPIKFRVWNKIEEKMVYYDKDCSSPDMTLNGVLLAHQDQSNVSYIYELMQFTGLKDKKRTEEYPEGQEIYEGDILQLIYETLELCGVVQQTESGEWELYKDEGNHVGVHHNIDRVEIIGNKWEHPELLEEK